MTTTIRTLGLIALAAALTVSISAQTLNGYIDWWETLPNRAYDVEVLADGSVWLTVGPDGLMRLDPTDASIAVFPPDLTVDFSRLAKDPHGGLWVSDHNNRIWHFDTTTGEYDHYDLPYPDWGTEAQPFSLTVGPDGAVWFTCVYDSGIGRLDPTGPDWDRFAPDAQVRSPNDLEFDSAGNLWFTLRGGSGGDPGLGRFHPSTLVFDFWEDTPYSGVMSPFGILLKNDEPWFSDKTANKIVHFSPDTETFTVYDTPEELRDAHFLTMDGNGIFYTVGYFSSSVAAFDPLSGEFDVRALAHTLANPMGIATAPDGRIWWAENGEPAYRGVGRLTPYGPAALAVGMPRRTVDGDDFAGAVSVLYGTFGTGIKPFPHQLWDQDHVGGDPAEEGDWFGNALASGDFDGDGFLDLAVGSEYEDVGTAENGGTVQVLYSRLPDGLTSEGSQRWHQGSPGVEGAVETGDYFGSSLATGDFDGDGFDDLAVGVPGEDLEGVAADAGCVNVLYGGPGGLTAAGDQLWHQDSPGIGGTAEGGDRFGQVLAAGDFDGDGVDDLAIGVPFENIGSSATDAGCVHVLYGSSSGLSGIGDDVWHQGLTGIQGSADGDERFGFALAVGDFEGDGFDDLAIGVPLEDIDSTVEAGVVQILHGTSSGLTDSGDQLFSQDIVAIQDEPEAGDHYGHSLATGDFDSDGFDDLAVGVPFENASGVTWAGAVNVLFGTAGGLHSSSDQLLHQDLITIVGDVEDECESWDRFGLTLAAGDFNEDGETDLAVGVPFEEIDGTIEAGAVNLFYGSRDRFLARDNQLWHLGRPDVAGSPAMGDRYGSALAAVYARHTLLFSDGFETGGPTRWSLTAP